MRRILFATAFVLFAGGLSAQNNDSATIKRISDEILSNGTAYTNLKFLCKQVGPRLSGSAQAEKAVRETARMMKEAGADTVWLQEVMVPHWTRGAKEEAQLVMADGTKKPLKVTALGNSVGTPAGGIKANVIEVRSMEELNQLGQTVKGKIVFFNHKMDPTFIRTFQAYGEAGIYRFRGPSMAAKYGAIGVIVRSLASNPDDHPHTGATGYIDSFPKIPAVAISTNDADMLSRMLKLRMAPSQVYFKTNCQMLPDVKSYNVIGEIRGKEFPDEIITVGGHLDSWDLAEGANDDGSGCVQSIEIIRAMKALGIQPKRSIRAVMFMNEENGLKGATQYAAVAKTDGKKHIFALESDAGGFTPRGFSIAFSDAQKAKTDPWKRLLLPYGSYEFLDFGGGADVGPLKSVGAVVAELLPDSQRYFDIHHAETDVFENVSRRELHLGAVNMAGLVWLVSEYGL